MMKLIIQSRSSGVLLLGCFGKFHVEDIVAQQYLVPGFGQNLCDTLHILDFPDVQICFIKVEIQGLFLDA